MLLLVFACDASGTATSPESPSPTTVPATDSPSPSPELPGSSLEFGITDWGSDYCTIDQVPTGGMVVSVWTMIPDMDFTYPWQRGNMNVLVVKGSNWEIQLLDGNSSASSASQCLYNANSMIFGYPYGIWAGDFSYYQSSYGDVSEAKARGWVWAAWWIKIDADSFAVRQWLKFGMDGPIIQCGVSDPSFAELRAAILANQESSDYQGKWTAQDAASWVPAQPASLQVGSYHGYLWQARVYQYDQAPTDAELDAMARHKGPDDSAWADYALEWKDGAPDLDDRSGNGRSLVLKSGGSLHEGKTAPF